MYLLQFSWVWEVDVEVEFEVEFEVKSAQFDLRSDQLYLLYSCWTAHWAQIWVEISNFWRSFDWNLEKSRKFP